MFLKRTFTIVCFMMLSALAFSQGEMPAIEEVYEKMTIIERSGKFGVLNSRGDTVIPLRYDQISEFNHHLDIFVVRLKYETDILRASGRSIIPEGAIFRGYVGNQVIVEKNRQQAIVSSSGDFIIPFMYNSVDIRRVGNKQLYQVCLDGKCGFIDNKMTTAIPLIYDEEFIKFDHGKATIAKNGKYGIINEYGETVVPFKYDKIYTDTYKILVLGINEKYQLCDESGNPLSSKCYDMISYNDDEHFFSYSLNSKFGYLDRLGNEITQAIYDKPHRFYNYNDCVPIISNGKEMYLTKKGTIKSKPCK